MSFTRDEVGVLPWYRWYFVYSASRPRLSFRSPLAPLPTRLPLAVHSFRFPSPSSYGRTYLSTSLSFPGDIPFQAHKPRSSNDLVASQTASIVSRIVSIDGKVLIFHV